MNNDQNNANNNVVFGDINQPNMNPNNENNASMGINIPDINIVSNATVNPNINQNIGINDIQQPFQNGVANQRAEINAIPTVNQNKETFISNTQTISQEKKEEKKSDINIVFVVILFVLIFLAIFFLFPFIQKNF